MHPKQLLAIVGLVVVPVMAGGPTGYGYGGDTDTPLSASTAPDTSLPSAIMPVTVTDSVTMTKPVTVTKTITITPADCDADTTIDGTTSTTVTTKNTVTVSVSPSVSVTTTETVKATDVPETGATSSSHMTPALSSTPSKAKNMTEPCESSVRTTGEVDGATGSMQSSTLTSTLTLSLSPTMAAPNNTTGMMVTHKPTPTTVPTSMGVKSLLDARLLAYSMGLVSLAFIIAF